MNKKVNKYLKYLAYLPVVYAFIFVFLILDGWQDWGGDFAGYLGQAIAFVNGDLETYRTNNTYTMNESERVIGPIFYPWGYSVPIALLYKTFGFNILYFKFFSLLSFTIFLLLLTKIFSKYLSQISCLSITMLFAFNPFMLDYNNLLRSDLPFLFSSVLAMYIIMNKRNESTQKSHSLILGFSIAISFFIRSNGLFLFIPLIVRDLEIIKKEKTNKKKLFGSLNTAYIVSIVTIIFWRFIFPAGGSSHFQFLKQGSLNRANQLLGDYLEVLPSFIGTVPYSKIWTLIAALFAIFGICLRFKEDKYIILYVLTNLGIILIWPSYQGLRFLLPVIPFLLFYTFVGIEQTITLSPLSKNWKKYLLYLPVIYLLGTFLYQGIHYLTNKSSMVKTHGPFEESSQELFEYVKTHTAEDATIVFFKPRVFTLLTGRRSFYHTDPDHILEADYLCFYLQSHVDGANYFQISPEKMQKLYEKQKILLVYKSKDFLLFETKTQK